MCFPGAGWVPVPVSCPLGYYGQDWRCLCTGGPELTQPPPPATAFNVFFFGSGPGI